MIRATASTGTSVVPSGSANREGLNSITIDQRALLKLKWISAPVPKWTAFARVPHRPSNVFLIVESKALASLLLGTSGISTATRSTPMLGPQAIVGIGSTLLTQ